MSSREGDMALAMAGLVLAGFLVTRLDNIPDRSFGDPLGAVLMPKIWIALLALCSAVIGVRAFLAGGALVNGAGSKEDVSHPKSVAGVVIAVIVYVLAMNYIGYYLATFLLATTILTIGRRSAWIFNLIVAAAITAAFYAVFGWGLGVDFPEPSILGY